MKRNPIKLIVSFILLLIISCNEPETVVTNILHSDGSVTRRIEMRSINEKIEERFRISDLQVPFDSTWTVRDSSEIDESGDTIWIRRAEKLFMNVDEINNTYKEDSGANRKFARSASFKRVFRWFNTEFRFSESFDKISSNGYPVSDFLSNEELVFFYSPEYIQDVQRSGPDSTRFKAISDSVSKKTELWTFNNLVSAWIAELSSLAETDRGARLIQDSLKSREHELVKYIVSNEDDIDSLWSEGIFLKKFLGESNFEKFGEEADTALERVSEQFWIDFKEYSVRLVMPGIVTRTNGFIDSSDILLWPVKSDYFLTEKYEMWAESKMPNIWAWVVSGLFLLFVISGVLLRIIKRG